MNRRTFGALALTGLVSATGLARGVMANGGAGTAVSGSTAPGAVFSAQAELKELDLLVTSTAIEGIPSTLEAGRYALNVSASADIEYGGGVEFVQPVGISAEEFMAQAVPQSSPDDGAASPAAEGGEEMGAPPPALWDSIYAGGTFVLAGGTARAIVDLSPGEWVVFGGYDNPQQPFAIEVTGEMPAERTEPESTATITMGEYVIDVTEGELVAGKQVVKIENIGAQPHFIVASFTEKQVTEDDVAAVLGAEMTGTPAAVDLNPDTDLTDAFYTGNQSTNTTMWLEIDLQPGTYVLLCFFPDQADMMPHAMHGMFDVITIGE
jgi:hypothetical protein